MAIIPGISILLGLTDLLSLAPKYQLPAVEFAHTNTAQVARIEDFPYQVSLRVNDQHRCSGSIISENKILTAAHCVVDIPVPELSVRVGSAKHLEGEFISIRAVAIHPTYNQSTLDCDVAFLTLDRDLTFGPLIKPIELAEKRLPVGTLADVTGWGQTGRGNFVTPDFLTVTKVRLIPRDSCQAWYSNETLTNRMVCASYDEVTSDDCQVDAGSPLVDQSTGKQVGVVSWGAGCSRPESPTVYASIPDLIHSKEV